MSNPNCCCVGVSIALAGLLALIPLVLPPFLPAITAEGGEAHQTFQEFARRNGELLDRIIAARSEEEADILRQAQQQHLKEWNEFYRRSGQ
jgi:hypothetical protein